MTCQVRSCTNKGRYPVTIWVKRQSFVRHLCTAHYYEHKVCGSA